MPKSTPLHLAARCNSYKDVVFLIETIPNLDLNQKDSFGNSAVTICVDHNNAKILKLLIDNGANVQVATSLGCSALDRAKRLNHPEIVELLELALVEKSNKLNNVSNENTLAQSSHSVTTTNISVPNNTDTFASPLTVHNLFVKTPMKKAISNHEGNTSRNTPKVPPTA